MAFELRLPDIGEGVAEGEIVRWLATEGEAVREDQPLVEVLTDKANVEIPSPVPGVLSRILAAPGRVVKVGEPIALIEEAGARAPAPETGAPGPTPPAATAPPPAAPPEAPGPHPGAGDVLATPPVRKLAKDLGLDLSRVPGTGPGGRVTEGDVRRAAGAGPAAASAPAPPLDEERIPFRGRRRMAAKKMVLAKSTVPHALVVDEADATCLLAARDAARRAAGEEGARITVLPFIVRAVVGSLRLHPALNASLDEERGEIVIKGRHDIGIAVDDPGGLVVPVVRNAGERTIADLAREIERLADGVRSGRLSPDDVGGSTFTVTSIGSIGGLFSYPVINVPEAGVLGVHRIVARPVAREGKAVVRDMVYLSLSFDHRIVDGGTATRFLTDVVRLVESISPTGEQG